MDPTTTVDPTGGVEDVYPIVALPLSLQAMMQSIMTTQAAHGQLLDEQLTEVVLLRVDFTDCKGVFPPPPPFED